MCRWSLISLQEFVFISTEGRLGLDVVLPPPGPLGLILVDDLLEDVLAGRIRSEAGPAKHVVPATPVM